MIQIGIIDKSCYIIFYPKKKERCHFVNLFAALECNGINFEIRRRNILLGFIGINRIQQVKFLKKNEISLFISFMWTQFKLHYLSVVPMNHMRTILIEEGSTSMRIQNDNKLKKMICYLAGYNYKYHTHQNLGGIYVSNKEQYDLVKNNKRKYMFDLESLESELDVKSRAILLNIFAPQLSTICVDCSKRVCVLYTQPLYIDYKVRKSLQYQYYARIVEMLQITYSVIIKPHPRDHIDYKTLTSAIVLSKNSPSEILNIALPKIDLALGVSSGAVKNAKAKTRINLNPYFDQNKIMDFSLLITHLSLLQKN
jgi:hypothetical protein